MYLNFYRIWERACDRRWMSEDMATCPVQDSGERARCLQRVLRRPEVSQEASIGAQQMRVDKQAGGELWRGEPQQRHDCSAREGRQIPMGQRLNA